MDSSPPPSSSAAPPPHEAEAKREEREIEMAHKTKVIQFLGRTTPIVLQNDNGPCPLLAICNLLSLKNSLNLSPDIPEVSQEKLLSLVAERLIDSNSNTENKDAGYLENQQQNIADAIDLLPRLTTGIDVNLKFRRIDDFEFTPECAIFDLLDIPLYHGWIVDPQDHETTDAIGSKSYNTLMGELVTLDTQTMKSEQRKDTEGDTVDFAASTTAALGVPSPCLSRGQSFDESPQKAKKGDREEEAELSRVLELSEAEKSGSVVDGVVELAVHSETVEKHFIDETANTGTLISDDTNVLSNHNVDKKLPEVFAPEAVCSFSNTENNIVQRTDKESKECCGSAVDTTDSDPKTENVNVQPVSFGEVPINLLNNSLTFDVEVPINPSECKDRDTSSLLTTAADLDSSRGQVGKIDKPQTFPSSVNNTEPMYEGEERIMSPGPVVYENPEPVYEGEVVLAEQVDTGCVNDGDFNDRISVKQGELIREFMKTSASQLTIYGLFCLQARVKERELCVFFRNNHFNTMFKYEGELYILATDQGYLNQPDLVWEKLNEVNGDTLYMTGNFKEFKMDDRSNSTWDEQNTLASTADYIASIDNVDPSHSDFNSDLQLAIALQQQEFEEQQQQQPQPPLHIVHEPAVSSGSGSRLITGPPHVSQSSGKNTPSSSSKQDSKSKEKCILM
ncbi:hypothetical protein ACP275_05G098800 [Erythranthe tilingii]